LRSTPEGVNNGCVRALPALLVAAALGCGSTHLVLDFEHRAEVREEELPAGISRVIYAVSVADDRGDDPNFVCDVGGEVLSKRPVPQLVREAVESELRVRDLNVVANPDEADVVLHIALQEFLCWAGIQRGAQGIHGKIQAELGLRLMPGNREVYWTTLTQEAFRVPSVSQRQGREGLLRSALEDVLGRFAEHVATHPDLMIEIQQLQARGELPE
jgi:hypothetical protein